MGEEEVIRFKHAYLQTKIDKMETLIKEYKKSIDECDPAGISSAAIFIGELGLTLKNEKQYLARKQEEQIDGLNREYTTQFQRLNIDKVSATPQYLNNYVKRIYHITEKDNKEKDYEP